MPGEGPGQFIVPCLGGSHSYNQSLGGTQGRMWISCSMWYQDSVEAPPSAVFEKSFSLLTKESQLAGDVDTVFPQTPFRLSLLPSLVYRTSWNFQPLLDSSRRTREGVRSQTHIPWSPQCQMMGWKGRCHETQSKQGSVSA